MRRGTQLRQRNSHESACHLPVSQSTGHVLFVPTPGEARMRKLLISHIDNPNTCRAYLEAVRQSPEFCVELGITDLA
jgi:hypothetical protein